MKQILSVSFSGRVRDACAVTVLTALNGYIALNLFLTEYLSHLESIEAAYISISRYILDHGFGLDWFPLWYVGIPFQNTYPPLLHLLVAGVAWFGRISPAHAHHVTVAGMFCIGPVLLYWMAKRFSDDRAVAFAGAVVFSITTPAVLSPSVRTWAGAADSARFLALINFGDGPHVAAVALIPLALMAAHWALGGPGLFRIYAAALACAAVVLTNWLGGFALALSVVSYLLARSAVERVDPRGLSKVAGIAALAYGCAMPWIPPSTIVRVQHNAQFTIGKYPMTAKHLLYAAPIIALAALLWWALRRLRASLLCGFGLFLSLFSCALVLTADYFDLSLMPQPHRYHHEMDLSLSIAGACIVAAILRRLDRRVTAVMVAALLVGAMVQARHARRRARVSVGAIDMTKTVEYQIPIWLRDHLGSRRIFTSGSIQFWLNAFADTPQVGGGFGQGIANDQIPIIHFGIPWTMGDGPDTAVWLKLYGAAAVVVAEPGSRDAYPQVWRDPLKFRGVLPEIYRDGGDVVYGVPLRSDSLAHVIRRGDVVTKAPINNADFHPVRPLVRALDDPSLPLAPMNCARPGDCTIRTTVAPGQVVFVQITYHRGWHASVNGERRRIERDGLGFMVIDPRCSGICEVRLIYDGGAEMWIAKLASLACNGFGLVAFGVALVRRKRAQSASAA